MNAAWLQVISALGGAAVTAFALLYGGRQARRQSEVATLLATLQADNADLREENRMLRETLSRNGWHEKRTGKDERTP